MDVVVEGHPAELEWLRREIERELGAEAQLEAIPSLDAEELREPLIIALIVSLGGPALVSGLVQVLKCRYAHKEEMERISAELRMAEMDHQYRLTSYNSRSWRTTKSDRFRSPSWPT
jgi:hypothetical protein